MKPWKSKLSEDDRWKVIAYERTFGLKGMEYDVVKAAWVPVGTAGSASEDGAAEGGPADKAPADGAGSEKGSPKETPQ